MGFGTETDGRDGGGGGGGGGEDTCYVEVPRHVSFSWVYFLPKNSGAECQFFRKILMHGNILLKSQNQPYRFNKVEKIHFHGQNYSVTSKKNK